MISWWDWRKAIFGKVDQNYRKVFLREDKKLVRILISIAAVWEPIYTYIEYLDIGLTPSFYVLIILRFFLVSGSILLFLKLPTINDIDKLDLTILSWSIAMVLLALLSNIYRNNLHIENVSASLAWMLGFYLAVPNRQLYKIIPALLLSIISLYTLFSLESTGIQAVTKPTLMANVSSIIAINVIGFLASLQLGSHRYQQYLIQKTMMDGRAQLKDLANTDSLTGMFNRRSFFDAADIQFDRFKRYKEIFSFVIADIDNLKAINDTYGHPAGDHSIGLLTGTIFAGKRSSDSVGRLAGDEIGFLLPNTSAKQALEVLTRIKDTLAETIVESPTQQQFQVRFSAGITEVRETDQTFDEIYRRADKALLKAKKLGRNRIEKI